MIKKIPVEQLRLGMHIHEFCGPWVGHPFWRSSFTLRTHADLQRIAAGEVKELWIDTDKGVNAVERVIPEDATTRVHPLLESVASQPAHHDQPEPTEAALQRASAIVRRAVPAIAALFDQARLGQAVQVSDCKFLVGEILESVRRNPAAIVSVARLKRHDTYTYMHSVAVCALMLSLGRQLGLKDDALKTAGLAGLLHDLGKVAVPPAVLNKPGRLTDAEFDLVKAHPEHGYELLTVGSACAEILDVCLHHHEKIDGSGYPHGLNGEQISQLAKMGAVCDVYDAVTSVRPYKNAWDPAEAMRCMAQWKGHFELSIFQAFVKTVGIYPAGSLVRLHSGRLAVVMAQNPQSLLTPRVKVFFSTKSGMRVDPYEVDLAGKQCQDKVVACESPDDWNFKDLAQLSCAT